MMTEVEWLYAELGALREEVAEWKRVAAAQAELHGEAEARAERLAEALALLPDEIEMVEHNPYGGPLMFCCGQRVTSSGLHDLRINHDKECWYAQMRAMRDSDQEDRND